MDSPQWDDMTQYPGRNALGMVLQDVRERLKPPGHRPANTALDVSAISGFMPPSTKLITQKKGELIPTEPNKDGASGVPGVQAEPNKEGIPGVPDIQTMAAQIKPTVIPTAGGHMDTVSEAPDINASVGSIDQEGVLLKLLHKTLGSADTEQAAQRSVINNKSEITDTHPANQGEYLLVLKRWT